MRSLLFALLVSSSVYGQSVKRPLNEVESCGNRFWPAVVSIQTERERGTGFLVSPDGWILTAGHVVINRQTQKNDALIQVLIPGKAPIPAIQALPIDIPTLLRDIAVLKIPGDKLPYLQLGNEDDAPIGSAVTIIGFPFSAIGLFDQPIDTKFCLFGNVSAQTSLQIGQTNIDVVYFQGPSIKGVSGSPVISRDTGKVIGIVNTRLTGLTQSLENLKENTARGMGSAVSMSGLVPGEAINQILDALDSQLANGLGSATGAADAAYAIKKAQRNYRRMNPRH